MNNLEGGWNRGGAEPFQHGTSKKVDMRRHDSPGRYGGLGRPRWVTLEIWLRNLGGCCAFAFYLRGYTLHYQESPGDPGHGCLDWTVLNDGNRANGFFDYLHLRLNLVSLALWMAVELYPARLYSLQLEMLLLKKGGGSGSSSPLFKTSTCRHTKS